MPFECVRLIFADADVFDMGHVATGFGQREHGVHEDVADDSTCVGLALLLDLQAGCGGGLEERTSKAQGAKNMNAAKQGDCKTIND